jgi:subtilisin family serine protease
MLRRSGLHRGRLVLAVLLSLSGVPASAKSRVTVPPHMSDEVIVEVEGSPKPQVIDALARQHHLRWIDSAHLDLANSTLYRLRIVNGRSVNEVIRSLAGEPTVKSAQPNFVFARPDVDATVPQFPFPHYALPQMNVVRPELDPAQYALPQLSILRAHHLSKGRSVVVAVMDSKIDHSHPDLAGVVDNVYDPGDRREPPHAHGTGVAGILAAQRRMGPLYLLGVARKPASSGSPYSAQQTSARPSPSPRDSTPRSPETVRRSST